MTDRPRIPQIPASEQKWSAKETAMMTDRDVLGLGEDAKLARLLRAALNQRDEARAERDRYREALERIAQAGEWPSGWMTRGLIGGFWRSPSVPPWRTMAEIARQALGGGDD